MAVINLTDADLDTPLYRVTKRDYVVALFRNSANVLVPPRTWDDPFENFILRSKVLMENGETGSFSFHDDFRAQCWTLHTASDAMWRIYSPDKGGVRMKTTIRKLYESLRSACGGNMHWQAHIGGVRYLRERQLSAHCAAGISLAPDGTGIAETLLVKRTAFRHEREVRLLFFADGAAPDLFRYAVDPSVLIEQLMVDPRLTVSEARQETARLRADTGWSGPILRSLLYRTPKGFVTRIRQ